jgi:subtilase family serine protease
VVETSETNNTYSRSIKIGGDLVITSLTVSVAAQDLTFSVNSTTTNEGAGATEASVTRFFLSDNSTLDVNDTPLDGAQAVPPLGPGIRSAAMTNVMIPGTTPAGGYYLLAKADADGAVAETSETNNTFARSIQVGADLVVSSMSSPAKGGAGGTIDVTDTTSNAGGGAAAGSVTRFYLSSNSTWDAADLLLSGSHIVPALAHGAADTRVTSLTIPAATVTGTHYVIARADADSVVAEAKETNNTLARSIEVGPDLDISSFTVPGKGGAGLSLLVSDTVTNQGGGSVATTTSRFYLSANSSLDGADIPIGSRTVIALAPGEQSTAPTTLMVPPGTSSGSYYVIAKADADGVAVETSESNNTFVRSVRIGPDLGVSTLTTSASSVAAGSIVTVTDKIINEGGGAAGGSATWFYLSINTSLDAADLLLTATRAVPTLAPGSSSTGATPVTVPAGTVAARYYILAKADGDGVVAETSESDNVLARSIQVTAP